jgi:HK97 family phage portal protein
MGLWGRIFGNEVSDLPASWKRDPLDDFWYSGDARRGMNAAQVRVTIEKARKVPVVRDCLAVLSQTIAGLSFGAFRYMDQNDRRRIDDHPVMRLFMNPNDRDTTYDFLVHLVDDLASWGFFLGEVIERDQRGTPIKIRRHDPKYVQVEELRDLSLRFSINKPRQAQRVLLEDEVWYLPTPPEIDGFMGRSAILDDGMEAIAAMIGMQDFANSFWANDATPPFVFKYGKSFADKESKDNFLRAWINRVGGRNRGRPGVLEHGIEIEQLGQSNEDSQFLETRKELALDIARLWRMPPHKIGILDRATYSNIEQQSLEFVVDTLVPWLRLIERSVAKFLIPEGDDAYFQFNVSSLLRGDTQQRFAAYAQARQWGWISVNEIRAMENMNSIGPAGDRYIEPLNMIEAGQDRDEARQTETQQALRVLHMTVPRVRSTADQVSRALDGEVLKPGAQTPPELKIVGGRHA